jgi:hypothetical protein
MSTFSAMTSEKLHQLVDDTEATLKELRSELIKRDHEAQSRELEHLDKHMRSAELSLQTIKDFMKHVSEEMRHNEAKKTF